MLVASQVMLSVVLPFVIFPLVWLCADEKVMMVRNGASEAEDEGGREGQTNGTSSAVLVDSAAAAASDESETQEGPPRPTNFETIPQRTQSPPITIMNRMSSLAVTVFRLVRYGSRSAPASDDNSAPKCRSFKSHWSTTAFGYALFGVVTVANAYVLLMLMMGKE
jgi:metal iron transporter